VWLVLAYQLPARPPHLRVRIWRRLQQIGAAVLRNSMYVLPNTAEAREDLEWVRSEIVAHRGQASLLEAMALDGSTDTDLVAQMRADRDAEYQAFMTAAARARDAARKASPAARAAMRRTLRTQKEQLASIARRDYFETPSRGAAQALVAQIERELGDQPPAAADAPPLKVRDFKGRVWLTRPHPGIDRVASAWFIRRFVDARARFTFGAAPGRQRRAIPFDMADVEFGHHGARCTFETLVHRFGVTEPAVRHIGEIVHDLDLKETRFGRPETAAIGRIVEGLRASGAADGDLLERGITVIEALYQSFAAESGKRRRSASHRG
jgi:hypothetical protein